MTIRKRGTRYYYDFMIRSQRYIYETDTGVKRKNFVARAEIYQTARGGGNLLLVSAGFSGLANRQLEPPCRRFLFLLLPLAATTNSACCSTSSRSTGVIKHLFKHSAYEVQFALSH